MNVEDFLDVLDADFFTGVPDSLLRPLCDCLINKYGVNSRQHIIAANEGNAVAIAAGYHLATGRIPVVYMQNSGEGNAVNPIVSLLSNEVYGIPVIFVVGWRGEPGTYDEPQHMVQGKITLQLLDVLGVDYDVIDMATTVKKIKLSMARFKTNLLLGKSAAFVVKKNAFNYDDRINYGNKNKIKREDAIKCILDATGDDLVICTTGKASRELFENRQTRGDDHKNDFLTVGSMGHCSSIALGIAVQEPEKRIWCIDGDGAAIMHMGAFAVIGNTSPNNMVHIVINNEGHESVGGIPTAASTLSFSEIAKSCGYRYVATVEDIKSLNNSLHEIKVNKKLSFLEIKTCLYSRKDLGRPTITPGINKSNFMTLLVEKSLE